MKKLNVGIVQMSCAADIAANKEKLARHVASLAREGASLIVLQELHNTRYFPQTEDVDNFDLAEPIPGPSTEWLSELARANGVVVVASLFERCTPGLHYNTAVVLDKDGTIAGTYRKMHIPDDPAYYEKFYFAPGDTGFRPIRTSVGVLGVQVCWDQWYPEGARLMALAGAEILIYPTAIGYAASDAPDEQARQKEAWVTVQRGHAVANGLPVVVVNRVGYEPSPPSLHSPHSDGIGFWGSSFVVGPQGEFLYQAPEDQEVARVVSIDMGRSEQVRRWWPFLRDRRIEEYGGVLKRFL